ncbi:MAG: PEGA domain-containing protein [Pseudomonadota bacterium]
MYSSKNSVRNFRNLFCVCAAAVASGCATNISEIVSNPPGATVTVEGVGECETPCTVGVDAPIIVTVAKPGYLPKRLRISPGATRVKVDLEQAAETKAVEEGTLPAL